MANVIFYEKPGCGTNARQKKALQEAGHTLDVRDLLSEPWTADRLLAFFGDEPVAAWLNPAAPAVKSGEVDPDGLDAATALSMMIDTPLLIRRPLIEADGKKCAGFSREPVPSLLGTPDGASEDLENCKRLPAAGPCPPPAGHSATPKEH